MSAAAKYALYNEPGYRWVLPFGSERSVSFWKRRCGETAKVLEVRWELRMEQWN